MLLMAAKFGVPVCPHAGGVGLCEYVQHLAIFDYIARQRHRSTTGSSSTSTTCTSTSSIRSRSGSGRYLAPLAPGYSIEMKPASLAAYRFPDGAAWVGLASSLGV